MATHTLSSVARARTQQAEQPPARPPVSRAQAAADALGSVPAEGLDPSRAEPLLAAWARGELSDAQLEHASCLLRSDRSLSIEQLLADLPAP